MVLDVDTDAAGAAAYLKLYMAMRDLGDSESITPSEYAKAAGITPQGARKRLARVKRLLSDSDAEDWLKDYLELIDFFENGGMTTTTQYAKEKSITPVGAWKRFDRLSEVIPLTSYKGMWMHVNTALELYEKELLDERKSDSRSRRRRKVR